jgi:hypothetical protein
MLSQSPVDHAWIQWGFAGLCGLLITIGIPWLLKHLKEVSEKHSALVREISAEHTERVEKLIDDHKVERHVHVANMDRVCSTFTHEMKEERNACERRMSQILGNKFTQD